MTSKKIYTFAHTQIFSLSYKLISLTSRLYLTLKNKFFSIFCIFFAFNTLFS